MPERTYYLVDGSGYIFRAFHALPMMNRPTDQLPVNAVYGFSNMLLRLLADIGAERIAVIFDASGYTFRNEIFADYKANRDATPEALVPQMPLIREATRAFNLPVIEKEGFEADDLIATYARLAREAGERAVIVSSDKDLMQLVTGGVTMYDPMKQRDIGPAEVAEKFGVEPERVVDVQALAGDSVDNVPGVPGIGIKTAAQLIRDFGSLDVLLDRAGEVKQPKRRQNLIEHAESARLSRRLVRLDDAVPVETSLDDLRAEAPDPQVLVPFLRAQGFNKIVDRAAARFGAGPEGATGADPAGAEVPANYVLVADLPALADWVARCRKRGVLGLRMETAAPGAPRTDLVGIALSVAPGEACYLPLNHREGPPPGQLALESARRLPGQLDAAEAVAQLREVLEDRSILKVGHNIKHEVQILARYDIDLLAVDDTMLMSYVLDGTGHSHELDALARMHLDRACLKYTDICGSGKGALPFDAVPKDKALAFCAESVDMAFRLHALLAPRLIAERHKALYEEIERPLARIIGRMETTGILVDADVLAEMSVDFAARIKVLEAEVQTLAGEEFNVGSPKQLATILFDKMGLQSGRRGKSGARSTDSGVLESLAAGGQEIAAKVLDWRQLAKLKSTYTDALVDQINGETGRVHTTFALALTNTGRLSSNDPNLQNIPIRTEEGRKIRTAFIAEPGYRLMSVDYSQIELRLAADMAGIEGLRRAFLEGVDIHAMTASEVFGIPLEHMDPETRRRAKAINFGIIYGISAFGLANQLGIAQREAKTFIAAYLDRYSELKDWMAHTRQFAKDHGYVETLFGRRCHLAGIRDPNHARRSFAERQAINAPLQGTAADIIKRAMGRLPRALTTAGLGRVRLLLQVHDELLFEVPEALIEEATPTIRQVMEGAARLSVPLVAEAGIGRNWGEAH